MKELIEEFNNDNGNQSFTQKDMTKIIIKKLDKIDDRLVEGEKRFISKSLVYKITAFVISCQGGLLYLILVLHGVI